MPLNGEINFQTRAAIVTLRCEGRGWTYISERVANCSPQGAQQFFQRVLRRAGLPTTARATSLPLAYLLTLLEDPHHRGREERFPEFSSVTNQLVENATQDDAHEDLPFLEVIRRTEEQLNVRIPYTSGLRALAKCEVVKRVPLLKLVVGETVDTSQGSRSFDGVLAKVAGSPVRYVINNSITLS
jgi:hypothetical protein